MAHRLALYRKYRSTSLGEVIGQEHITKTLEHALAQNRIGHAYLFTGPRGTGKTSVARILAHEVNKLPYSSDATHLDIIEIDAASNRRIDEVRDLREKVHIAPAHAPYKVYIIDEVHMLTREAFNALLKTLEEPPAHVIFILATTEVHKLPETIISRTQRHTFLPVEKSKVVAHLGTIAQAENIPIDDEALALIADHGEGSFRDSISLLDQISNTTETSIGVREVEHMLGLAPNALLQQLLASIQTDPTATVLEQLDAIINHGVTASQLANQLANAARHEMHNDLALCDLADQLIDVASSYNPQLKLEIVLMRHALRKKGVATPSPTTLQTPVATKPDTTSETPAKKPEPTERPAPQTPPQEALPTDEKEEPQDTKKEETPAPNIAAPEAPTGNFSVESHWPTVLERVKQHNNPLYAVLRMAQANYEDDELQLVFRFPFHKKRIDESDNRTILVDALNAVAGSEITLTTSVNSSAAVPENPRETVTVTAEPVDPRIEEVIDIMGGGEMVQL